jgi:aryl-alcohol dehydrogenase-like predicted oxidoreductase
MASAFFTYKLKTGVTPETYEKWIVEFDYPHVQKMAGVILSQRIYRVKGTVFGGGEPPYDYVEVIEFTNLDDYLHLLKTNPNAQAIAAQVPKYVEMVSNTFGRFIQPGVQSSGRRLLTRELGRTRRQVTTLGLGGQAALMLPVPDTDPVSIIEKAYRLGLTYFDTSNAYGPSQSHYGSAFGRLGLIPNNPNHDPAARARIYLASKTHMRTTRHPQGQLWRNDYSDGMNDNFKVGNAVDDVRRSLSLMFGDGKGGYPEGAYLDCIQIHNITAQDDVDMIYEGLEHARPDADWLGALVGLLDLRDGTNRSGANPKGEKLVRHIGITGHWNAAALIYAIQRDSRRILDTLLVALNPSDLNFLSHQNNTIPVARAAGMGVIAMKLFGDASYYGAPATFMRDASQVYRQVGSRTLPSAPLIRYALSTPGVTLCLTGIGHIDEDPEKCQLTANLRAAQLENPLTLEERRQLEEKVAQAGVGEVNHFFQRPFVGLTPPRNLGAESDPAGFTPVTPNVRPAVRISWDMAHAGRFPVDHYEVIRDGKKAGSIPHFPQWTSRRFVFEDTFNPAEPDARPTVATHGATSAEALDTGDNDLDRPQWTCQQSAGSDPSTADQVGRHTYVVCTVDSSGAKADSVRLTVVMDKGEQAAPT